MTWRGVLARSLGVTILAILGLMGCGAPQADSSDIAVIYGQDWRREVFEYGANSFYGMLAQSTAVQTRKTDIQWRRGPYQRILATTLAEDMEAQGQPLCQEERFRNEPVLGSCSGFLVGPDLYVTAGHCMESQETCNSAVFIFGAGYDRSDRDPGVVRTQDIYGCKEVVKQALNPQTGLDFAVIRLDRPVPDRRPLRLRASGKIADNAALVVIGHPVGLPTKISPGGRVLNNASVPFFRTNLDSFHGNSGAAVFDGRTGLVEGVLVRGEDDFALKGDCFVSRVCPENGKGCRGEDVTRATEFAGFVR